MGKNLSKAKISHEWKLILVIVLYCKKTQYVSNIFLKFFFLKLYNFFDLFIDFLTNTLL